MGVNKGRNLKNHFQGLVESEITDTHISASLTEVGRKLFKNNPIKDITIFIKGIVVGYRVEIQTTINGTPVSASRDFLAYRALVDGYIDAVDQFFASKEEDKPKIDEPVGGNPVITIPDGIKVPEIKI